MALLDSGSTSTFTGSSASVNVAVTAGSGSRKLIVGIAMESAVTVTALTFNGVDLVDLGLEIPLTGIVTDAVSTCIMFEQFEAGLPASGSTALALTLSGSATGGGRMFYWLVDAVRQDQLAEGGSGQVGNVSGSSTSTFQTDETFPTGDDARVICGVAYRNDNATSLLLTTPSSATNVADVTVTGGGRVSGSAKVGSMGTGTVSPTWTTQATGQNRRTGAACVLNPVTSASLTADAAFTAGAATSAATASRGREATAAFAAGSATAAATLTRARDASAAFQAGSASSSTTAVRGHPATASFAAGSASFSATVDVSGNKTATAAFSAGSATMAATAIRARTAQAAFSAGSAAMAATATVGGNKSLTAAFSAGPAAFSASLARELQASAGFVSGPAGFYALLSVPDPGTGDGFALVYVPRGTEEVEVASGTGLVTIPRGTVDVQVQ